MSLVLAIEPDSGQADRLRQMIRDQVDAELVMVTSAYAAIVAMNRQVPDVLLFGRSVAHRHQNTVLKHLRSLNDGAAPQALTIPSLTPGEAAPQKNSRFGFGWGRQATPDGPDPARFVEQITEALAKATAGRRRAPDTSRRDAVSPVRDEPASPAVAAEESAAEDSAAEATTAEEASVDLDAMPSAEGLDDAQLSETLDAEEATTV